MLIQLPRYEYSRSNIRERIAYLKNLQAPFGLTVRYAVKANPFPEILRMMQEGGIDFDVSSSYEGEELIALGIPGNRISLSSQQSPHNLEMLCKQEVSFVATSVKQLKDFLEMEDHPNTVGIRINPDLGKGHNNRTSTGGTSASFGIWHEYIPECISLAGSHSVTIDRLHIHVGSGADPKIWGEVLDRALEIVRECKTVTSLDIGGGFKVHRYGDEREADMDSIMQIFSEKLQSFYSETGREIHLEIEPGTYLIAHAGTLIASVDDIVDTGAKGYTFLRLTTGMNDFLRSTLYGAQHVIEVINDSAGMKEYVVVGHNCESGDIFTTAPGNPEEVQPRLLKQAAIGDEVRIYDAGAYCASMSAKGYNSFPSAEECMVD